MEPVAPPAPETADMQGSMPPTTITPQNKLPLFLFCVFVALAIVVVFFYLTHPKVSRSEIVPTRIPISPANIESPTPKATTSAEAQTNPDLPPLFPGVEWEATTDGKFLFINSANQTVEVNGYRIISKNMKYYPSQVLTYFNSELNKIGWEKTDDAGGDRGEVYGYEKRGKYYTLGARGTETSPTEYYIYIEHN